MCSKRSSRSDRLVFHSTYRLWGRTLSRHRLGENNSLTFSISTRALSHHVHAQPRKLTSVPSTNCLVYLKVAGQGPHALCLIPIDATLPEPVNCVDVKARKGQFDIITIRPFPRNILHSARDGKLSVRRHCLEKYHNHTYVPSNRCEYSNDHVRKITAVRSIPVEYIFYNEFRTVGRKTVEQKE